MAYTADGEVIGSADNTVTVGDVWTGLNFEFDIDETTTINSIKVFLTHAVANHNTIKLNIKGMMFNGEAVAVSDHSGVVDTALEAVKVVPSADGNKFLTVYDRNYQWTGAKIQFEAKPGITYSFTFRARLTVDAEVADGKVPQLRVLPYDPKGDCVKIKDSTSHLSLRNIVSDGTWTYYKIENMFVTTEGTAMLLLLPYGSNYHWYSFDIDDICIVDSEGNTVVYNNFEAYEIGAMEGDQTLTDEFGGKIINYRYDGNAKHTTSFAVNNNEDYYAVNVANGETFTSALNKELEAGNYTYSVKLRNNENIGSADYMTAATGGVNNNTFSAYAVAYTADGTEIGSAENAVTVGDVWSDLDFEFTLDDTTTIYDIKIFLTHTVEAHETIKLNIKDAVLTKEIPDEPAVCGDVNNDGKITPLDVVYLTRYAAEWDGYDAMINANASDVNGDGEVTFDDAVVIARYLAKWLGYDSLPYTK